MDRERFERLFASVRIDQGPEEFFWLVNHVETLSPNVIIEIGIQHGGSLKFWEQLVPVGGAVIGVDTNPLIEWDITSSDRNIIMIKGDTTDEETVREVIEKLALISMAESIIYQRKVLEYKQADFLYIDGDHKFETVKNDFDNYAPYVRSGGLVGFHDLYTDHGNPKKVFDALKGRKEERHLKGQGTGIWWKP